MSIEDRLRDALQATANTVDDQVHRPLPERRPRPSMLRLRLVPLGAVAGVLILLVGFLTAQRLWDDPAQRLQRTPAMPKFIFVSTSGSEDGREPYGLEVRDSATGRLIDRHQHPRGMVYGDVAALSDNRTFYVASESDLQKPCQTTIQRVRVSEAGKIIALEPIPGGPVVGIGAGEGGLAVTPNGTKLAYSARGCGQSGSVEASVKNTRIAVIDLVSNARREWRYSDPGDDAKLLSWTADGNRLFFVHHVETKDTSAPEGGMEELRTIDASVPAEAPLTANSTLIQKLKPGYIYSSALPSPDGRSVITSNFKLQLDVESSGDSNGVPDSSKFSNELLELLELSTRDGRMLRQIRLASAARLDIASFKDDASGQYLLTSGGIVDLSKGGSVRPLKGLVRVNDLDW